MALYSYKVLGPAILGRALNLVPCRCGGMCRMPGEPDPAYRLGDRGGFLSADGSVWCRHGNKLPPLTGAKRPRAFKAERGKCGCEVRLPGRVSCVPLGRIVVKMSEV